MPIKPGKLERLLQRKFGFTLAETHASDHRWYKLKLPDLPVILTKVSHTKKEIGSKLEAKIARQLLVPNPFFKGMIGCTNNREDYYQRLREDPLPPISKR